MIITNSILHKKFKIYEYSYGKEMLLNEEKETYKKYIIKSEKGACILFDHDIISNIF
jgi:hypothetical protein